MVNIPYMGSPSLTIKNRTFCDITATWPITGERLKVVQLIHEINEQIVYNYYESTTKHLFHYTKNSTVLYIIAHNQEKLNTS